MFDGPGLMTSFGITVPISRSEYNAGVSQANAMVRMNTEEKDAMSQMIEGDVGAARDEVIAARGRAKALRERVLPLARESAELTLADYGGTGEPIVSVLESVKTLRDLEMQQVSFDAAELVAWVKLGRAVGTLDLESLVQGAETPKR